MLRSLLTWILALFVATCAQAEDWPQFLGQGGVAKSKESVPTSWNESENLLWKFELPGPGSSSPIVVGDRIFVTCYSGTDASLKRHIVCVNKVTGKKLWDAGFDVDYREDGYRGYITEHGYASNTPISDGKLLFAFLGKGGVHAFDLDGKPIWNADVGKSSSNRRWGSGSSLVLFQNSVIVNAADESKSIVAFEKSTGKELWRQQADMLELAYGTPRIVALPENRHDLVISVPGEIWGLNPETGKLRWYAETALTGNVSPSLIVDEDKVYSFGGFRSSGSIAVNAGGKGDVTDTHTQWTSRSSSYVATPLLNEGKLFWVDDRGIAYCTDADDGELIYRERVQDLKSGRPVYASPTLIGKYIYVVTRQSGTIVYSPTGEFKPLKRNVIAGDESDFNASPAVSDGRLYLRSNKALYCVGKK